ncbi:MAG: hypothetical protein FE78DRAFT_73930 [Acidomyces sp. 'richmondensis']|nr:MAG: hypothetical protein FE78DRAFT_73930 [Acidomyces sp. 'richmondensis']
MSGGSNNVTISRPGPSWETLWPSSLSSFQLDIVGFLAILGEGSVTANAQVQTLSWLFYLPRLIPAPQALLWPSRPEKLPGVKAVVSGVHSGNLKDNVYHIASVLLGEDLKPNYSVRCVQIWKSAPNPSRYGGITKGKSEGESRLKKAETSSPQMVSPPVTAKNFSPLGFVALLGFSLFVVIFVISYVYGDGMSILATILLSVLSTLVGVGNKSTLRLAEAQIQSGENVVIRYPSGSFLIVKCDEQIARELFFAPEEIVYKVKSRGIHRLISLIGTLLLMLGVIALANARLELQFAWAGAYIIINIAYWIVAALPPRLHWDLTCYTIKEESLSSGSENPYFTDALWKAIVLTQSTKWVHLSNAAPRTDIWDKWLEEALNAAKGAKPNTEELKDPLFSKKSSQGTVWTVPDWNAKKQWDLLKAEWDKINNNPTLDRVKEAEVQAVREKGC